MGLLGNDLKKGFYPTPDAVGEKLKSILDFGNEEEKNYCHRILDPCAGTGEILQKLSPRNDKVQTYAIELDDRRFSEVLEKEFSHALHSAYENVISTNDCFSLVYNNPPYNDELVTVGSTTLKRKSSMEIDFFERAHRQLMNNGIHIFVVPLDRFIPGNLTRLMVKEYKDIQLFRFDEDEYEKFNQVVFIGRKSVSDEGLNDSHEFDYFNPAVQYLNEQSLEKEDLMTITEIEQSGLKIEIPYCSKRKKVHWYSRVDYRDDYTPIHSEEGFCDFKDRLSVVNNGLNQDKLENRSKMPINNGQLGLLLVSGLVKGEFGSGPSYHIAQGSENIFDSTEIEVFEYSTKETITTKREAMFTICTEFGVKRLKNK